MTNTFAITERFAEEAGKENPKFLHNKSANVFEGRERGRPAIYSYGYHFPMAVLMPDDDGNPRGWWLVNGDKYSISTTRHQNGVRSALQRTGLPMVIIPFSAIREAGIDQESIKRIEVLPDRYTWEPRTRDEAPKDWELRGNHGQDRDWSELPDGRWAYMASVHHLGESLITAKYDYRLVPFDRETGRYPHESGTAYFLSAFDENEGGVGGLYFLCQLPESATPTTVAEAREALKPSAVLHADKYGTRGNLPVLRQGDVFAVPTEFDTRDLPGPSQRSTYVLGVNHVATEVRTAENIGGRVDTYGRGYLRHKPRERWRRPQHRQVKLGDGKTWYLLVKNTVPEGRSWSMGGNVD
jgi:hypothetical protein